MSTVIRFKRKNTTGSNGITLLPGEPFFNVKDKKFYIGNDEGKPQDIAGIKINNDAADDTVDFTIGTDQYQKTINNVAHSFESEKLTSKSVGSTEVPVYFTSEGKPAACELPKADSSNYGLVKLGYVKPATETSNYRPVVKDTNGRLYVHIAGEIEGVATSAEKLTTTAVGSATQPVYFNNGVPVATTYMLNETVPKNAVFTDTKYNYATQTSPGLVTIGPFDTEDENSLALLKSDSEPHTAYVDVTKINNRIKTCEESLTWGTF